MTLWLVSAQQSSCRCYNTICCSNLWVKPLDIKGGKKKEREEPCFLLLFFAPVKMVCLGSFFPCFCCCFICCYCTHQPASFVTPQRPLVELRGIAMCLKVCACVSVWSRTDPNIPKTHFLCLFHFRTLSHTHTHAHTSLIFQLWTTFLLFFCFWAVRQNAKLPPPSLHTHAHTHLKFRAFSASPSQIFPVNALAIIWVH